MAVNGVEITVGSKWLTHYGELVTITAQLNEKPTRWMVTHSNSDKWYVVDDAGESDSRFNESNLAAKVVDTSATQKVSNPKDLVGDTKVPLWLLSPVAKAQWAVAQYVGMVKYGAWNWREVGVRSSVYLSALGRHLDAYLSGEELDPKDLTPHLGHIMACAAILIDAKAAGKLIDDRPPRVDLRPSYAQVEQQMAHIRTIYADMKPIHYTIENCVVTK